MTPIADRPVQEGDVAYDESSKTWYRITAVEGADVEAETLPYREPLQTTTGDLYGQYASGTLRFLDADVADDPLRAFFDVAEALLHTTEMYHTDALDGVPHAQNGADVVGLLLLAQADVES